MRMGKTIPIPSVGCAEIALTRRGTTMNNARADGDLDHVLTKPIDPLELLRVSNHFKAHI